MAVHLVKEPVEQVCNACGVSKPLDDFFQNADGRNGRRQICKACEQDPDRLASLSKTSRAWRKKNPQQVMLQCVMRRAKEKGITFDLQPEDVVIPTFCPILHVRLEVGCKESHDFSPTLDRIIPDLGYVKGNVVVISRKANCLKGSASAEQHRLIADWIDSMRSR